MSRAGVTHFFHNETDFTSLDQWEREYFLFTKMMKIDFFENFRIWKGFYFWKKLIRRTKTYKYSRFLTDNLYILNRFLCVSLQELRKECHKASKWNLYRLHDHAAMTLQEYNEMQELQKKDLIVNLRDLHERISAIVVKACDIDLAQFLITNGFRKPKGDEKQDTEEGENDDYPKNISHAENAAIRTKCRKLTKYIRLADYFVINTLISLSFEQTTMLANRIDKPFPELPPVILKVPDKTDDVMGFPPAAAATRFDDDDTKEGSIPQFSVKLILQTDTQQLKFLPSPQEFQDTIEKSIDKAIKTISVPTRLTKDDAFHFYTKVTESEDSEDQSGEVNVDHVVLNHANLALEKERAREGLTRAFEAAQLSAERYEKYKSLYLQNIATNIESFRYAKPRDGGPDSPVGHADRRNGYFSTRT